jgi:murein DD-endopeptidase MepM/ murein hydrolase activator NlpD
VHFLRASFLILSAALLSVKCVAAAYTLTWPTPNPSFNNGEPYTAFIQPTAAGDPVSGTFGGVRNNGYRFHEGIDIKPFLKKTRKGEPTDPVYAAMDGVVAHISTKPGNSGYGRYVVITHNLGKVEVYTLYAHMAEIDSSIVPGTVVKAGSTLGKMGRSAGGYSIPRDRSHLHFEIGLKYGSRFQQWYDRQQFGSPNYQRDFNGMNLEGFDPLRFFIDYKAGNANDMCEYIRNLPAAYVVRVNCAEVPEILNSNYGLLTKDIPPSGLAGWDIAFTWYGLPTLFTPLTREDLLQLDQPGVIRLKAFDRALVTQNHSRDTVKMKNGKPTIYGGTTDILEMIFGHKISQSRR